MRFIDFLLEGNTMGDASYAARPWNEANKRSKKAKLPHSMGHGKGGEKHPKKYPGYKKKSSLSDLI